MVPATFDEKLIHMKSILLTLTVIMVTLTAIGQENSSKEISSGRITYEEKIKLDIKIEGEGAQYADMLPKERKTEKILQFTNEATLFEEEGGNVEEEMTHSQGEGIRIKMVGSGGSKIFTDLKNNTIIEQRDFMNRMFLVEKKMPESNWKVTGNQKVILGYQCMEATRQDTAGIKTVIWFTPTLNIKSGPSGFCNLPGMVLEVDINGGSRTYIAKSVEQLAPGELKMEKPKDGKKVTEEEYKIMVAEKMKEMGIEQGEAGAGATQVRIVIKR